MSQPFAPRLEFFPLPQLKTQDKALYVVLECLSENPWGDLVCYPLRKMLDKAIELTDLLEMEFVFYGK